MPETGSTPQQPSPPAGWEDRWPPLLYWAKVVVVVIATIWVMFAVRTVATILLLVVISLVLAVGAEPPVAWLTRKGLGRGLAVFVVIATVLIVIGTFLALLIPVAAQHIGSLSTDLPDYLSQLQARGGWAGEFLQKTHGVEKVQAFLDEPPAQIGTSMSTLLGIAGRVGSALLALGTIAVLTVYFMLSMPGLRARAPMLFRPGESRARRASHRAVADAYRRLRGRQRRDVGRLRHVSRLWPCWRCRSRSRSRSRSGRASRT